MHILASTSIFVIFCVTFSKQTITSQLLFSDAPFITIAQGVDGEVWGNFSTSSFSCVGGLSLSVPENSLPNVYLSPNGSQYYYSQYVALQNWSFSIPSNATIIAIRV